MCEVFPYFPKYCFFIPLWIGLLCISIQSIMTGVAGLSGLHLATDIDYYKLKEIIESITHTGFEQLTTKISFLIIFGFTLISFVYILMGLTLLFSTLWNDEGLIQVFIWGTFLNVIFGYVVTVALGVDCVIEKSCLLSSMDWLSVAGILMFLILYFTLWMYYVCVAHSYIQDNKNE